MSQSVGLSVRPSLPLPSFPTPLASPCPGPPVSQAGCRTGVRRRRFGAWLPGGLRRSVCVWGGWSARPTGRLTPPLPLPAAPGRRGPAALVSEIFEQHLGGHILQVGPSLPAAPCCHLVAASGNSTLFSSIHPIGSPGTGGPNPGAPPPTWPSRGPPKTLLPHPQSNPS